MWHWHNPTVVDTDGFWGYLSNLKLSGRSVALMVLRDASASKNAVETWEVSNMGSGWSGDVHRLIFAKPALQPLARLLTDQKFICADNFVLPHLWVPCTMYKYKLGSATELTVVLCHLWHLQTTSSRVRLTCIYTDGTICKKHAHIAPKPLAFCRTEHLHKSTYIPCYDVNAWIHELVLMRLIGLIGGGLIHILALQLLKTALR